MINFFERKFIQHISLACGVLLLSISACCADPTPPASGGGSYQICNYTGIRNPELEFFNCPKDLQVDVVIMGSSIRLIMLNTGNLLISFEGELDFLSNPPKGLRELELFRESCQAISSCRRGRDEPEFWSALLSDDSMYWVSEIGAPQLFTLFARKLLLISNADDLFLVIFGGDTIDHGINLQVVNLTLGAHIDG